jgi:hypothetical protein
LSLLWICINLHLEERKVHNKTENDGRNDLEFTSWRQRLHVRSTHIQPPTRMHGITTHKTTLSFHHCEKLKSCVDISKYHSYA